MMCDMAVRMASWAGHCASMEHTPAVPPPGWGVVGHFLRVGESGNIIFVSHQYCICIISSVLCLINVAEMLYADRRGRMHGCGSVQTRIRRRGSRQGWRRGVSACRESRMGTAGFSVMRQWPQTRAANLWGPHTTHKHIDTEVRIITPSTTGASVENTTN